MIMQESKRDREVRRRLGGPLVDIKSKEMEVDEGKQRGRTTRRSNITICTVKR